MSCQGCSSGNLSKPGKDKKYSLQQCCICVGMENDHTLKSCYHCDACDEWICDNCTDRWMSRGILAVKKLFRF